MGSLIISLLLVQSADAGRKGDTIRLLNLESRYTEAQTKCKKWGALERTADQELRSFCAQAHWVNAEEPNTIEAWQAFQEQWAGTDWAEKAFVREGRVALASLGDESPEPAYLGIADQFAGFDVALDAKNKAGAAAIRDAQSQTDAERIRLEYENHENMEDLILKYPGAFYKLMLTDDGIIVSGEYELNALVSEPFWGYRLNDEVVPWTDAVRKHLEEAGVPAVRIMKSIQENPAPTFELCPFLVGGEDEVGLAMTVGSQTVFIPQNWSTECDPSSTSVAVYSNRTLLHISLEPEHNISFGLKRGRRNFTSFVRKTGEPILFENRIFVPIGKSFAIYPLSGETPWLTDQPPGAMRTRFDNTIRGTGVPEGWSIAGIENGVEISSETIPSWTFPQGELRFFSPLMRDLMGMNDIELVQPREKQIPWSEQVDGISSMPEGALTIDYAQLKPDRIKSLNNHIGGAGLDTFKLSVVDGYRLDLDGDQKVEKILRAQFNGKEVVLILDSDENFGNRTWIFETEHAIHGKMAPPKPMAFISNGERIFAWSGTENNEPYVEVIYTQGSSFTMD